MDDKRTFSPEELARNDGSEGKPVYVAVDGKVVDLSESKLWKNGRHMNRHTAGGNMSEEIKAAPHGPELLERFPQIGVMQEEGQAAPKKRETKQNEADDQGLPAIVRRFPILKRHPHPMTVHFPIVFSLAAAGFTLLYLLTGAKTFDAGALDCLGANVLFTPVAIFTGLATWRFNYGTRFIRPVLVKLVLSPLLFLASLSAFIWRLGVPDILEAGAPGHLTYVWLVLALAPVVSIIGWFGAGLTFPSEK
ncbi:cytochrome b5 [Desulfovibrio sp. X2]|uniref:DUF2231 domain-containing protein n=1 Tax=Desulfovibrio sp. X2 TaxID=941449 RepID=UPI000358BF75|nr:DUF2231 domain-containing protein [Desulfovibrio sp. X2]EPR37537.1 cytochrome b5 [Desulfovibrio sp. X2]